MNKIIILFFGILFLASSVQGAIHLPPIKVVTPADITYEEGSTGNELVWQFNAHESADNPTTYTVTIDTIPLAGHIDASWSDNVDIVVNVDGLSVGVHIVEITVNDNGVDTNQAQPAVDTVTVTVTAGSQSVSSSIVSTPTSATSVTSSPTMVSPSVSSENDTPVSLIVFISSIFFLVVLPKIRPN